MHNVLPCATVKTQKHRPLLKLYNYLEALLKLGVLKSSRLMSGCFQKFRVGDFSLNNAAVLKETSSV